ncbi:uncharacterized protein [Euwallacea fornicatus]|uniref:uncharacterized protein n=1 Tax=Euwallacea fornicatus TaxID=995702 RepID=UPI00338F4BE6
MHKTRKSKKLNVDIKKDKQPPNQTKHLELAANSQTTTKLKKPFHADTISLKKTEQRKVFKQTKKIKNALKKGTLTVETNRKEPKKKLSESRGLIYIGHIPHGFYEEEMAKYFKQFGKVTNMKLCRSRVSGRSKGYGYVEFQNPEVAKIAADTMNNYIMFQKRIVVEYVPYEKRPKGLFHGKSSTLAHTSVKTRQGKQKFSKNKVQLKKIVERKTRKTLKKLNSKIEQLKGLGIKCNLIPVNASNEILKKTKLQDLKMNHNSKNNVSDPALKNTTKNCNTASKKTSSAVVNLPKTPFGFSSKPLSSIDSLLANNPGKTDEMPTKGCTKAKKEHTVLRGGILKKKKSSVKLDSSIIKKISKDLVQMKEHPLINFVSGKKSKQKK